MQLTPRYGAAPVLALDGDLAAVAEPLIRQRRRCIEVIQALTDDQWSSPSRCEGWSARDVVVHLGSTNAYWEFSIRSGLAGAPSEVMARFDPVASPAQLVSDSRLTRDEIISSFSSSSDSLATLVEQLATDDWNALAEAPPGHVTVGAVAHHALWDSWIHERDILVPLGLTSEVHADEVAASLRYVAGLTPALALNGGATGSAGFDVDGTDPDIGFHVEIGADVRVGAGTTGSDFVLRGPSVDLLEALSLRRPLEQAIPDALGWAFAGLATVFDR
jgi:uncharacterized protein (TIGR03083 family)